MLVKWDWDTPPWCHFNPSNSSDPLDLWHLGTIFRTSLPEGLTPLNQNPIQPPFSYGFPLSIDEIYLHTLRSQVPNHSRGSWSAIARNSALKSSCCCCTASQAWWKCLNFRNGYNVGIAMSKTTHQIDGLYHPFVVMNGGWFMKLLYQHYAQASD